jgi:thiamine biosynthesis lipoprotein
MRPISYTESKLRVALGTFVAVDAEAARSDVAGRGIEAAFEALSTVERLMHPSRPGSDLSALAECPAGRPLSVDPWTFEVLELCKRLHECSNGAFDPCLDLAPGRMDDLDLLDGRQVLPHVRMRIDLGGIAKGYAVDRAVQALRSAGCSGGLVNAGGDLAVFGDRAHAIVCRGAVGADTLVELRNCALATSDADDIARPSQHRGYYHGLDRSAAVSGRVTVAADRTDVADALTKCLLLGQRAANETLLNMFGARQIHPVVPVAEP